MIEISKDIYAVCPLCSAIVFNNSKIINHCDDVGKGDCIFNNIHSVHQHKVATIPLNDGSLALVDARHMSVLKCYAWMIHRDGYAYGKVNEKNVYLHRLIYELEFGTHGDLVDHINGNRLDNRVANLRKATHKENRRNTKKVRGTSKYIGVYYNKKRNKWCASIQHEGKNRHIGYYDVELDAARAYNEKAREFYGDYAKLNEV